jgi:TPP-dependent pyruvate/acetoin dehydrogenase alpha subunit
MNGGQTKVDISKKYAGLVYQMVLVREFETACDNLYKTRSRGVYALYSGQKPRVGALSALEKREYVTRPTAIAARPRAESIPDCDGRDDGQARERQTRLDTLARAQFLGRISIVGGHLRRRASPSIALT